MEKLKIFLFIFLLYFLIFPLQAQTIKRVKDPHIVGQEKRQVFQEWGDWQPEGKYFLGIQYNYHYTMVWGWASPNRNKRYKEGDDIRPLSLTGLQNQRYATTLIQEQETDKIMEHSKVTHDETFDEFMHISKIGVQADPLYILYYKKALEQLAQMENLEPNDEQMMYYKFTELGLTYDTFHANQKYNILSNLARDISTLSDKYKMAKDSDMPRGKRILLYHDCLIEWRKIKSYVNYLNRQTNNRLLAEKRLKRLESMKKNGGVISRERRDAEIFMDILLSNPMKL